MTSKQHQPPGVLAELGQWLANLAARLVVALLWLAHHLPLPVLAVLGRGFGRMLGRVARRRRIIARVNLSLCFAELDVAARDRLLGEHFALLGRSLLERGLLWWGTPERIRAAVSVSGLEHFTALRDAGEPIILLVPHFLGLDAAGTRLALEMNAVSIYARQKNPVFDYWLYHGRARFGDQRLLSRNDSVRTTVRAMREGRPLFYLPDLDYGRRESVFVPFFGVPAATITALPRLARISGARVLPVRASLREGGGYHVCIDPPWEAFPGEDVTADSARMNTWLEGAIREMPAQYYWVHRRFKTRPGGEAQLYPFARRKKRRKKARDDQPRVV